MGREGGGRKRLGRNICVGTGGMVWLKALFPVPPLPLSLTLLSLLPLSSLSLRELEQDRKDSTNIIKCKCRGFCARARSRRESLNLPIWMGAFILRVHGWINSLYFALVFRSRNVCVVLKLKRLSTPGIRVGYLFFCF